ncbi:MAG: hypothetical protein HFH50_10900 [Lachnospiraceae bacterium]|jgi:hypothetical protein|nr:hypothetical protein [Lachnospiraceae bacterium]
MTVRKGISRHGKRRNEPLQDKKANSLIRRECCNCEGGDCIVLDVSPLGTYPFQRMMDDVDSLMLFILTNQNPLYYNKPDILADTGTQNGGDNEYSGI